MYVLGLCISHEVTSSSKGKMCNNKNPTRLRSVPGHFLVGVHHTSCAGTALGRTWTSWSGNFGFPSPPSQFFCFQDFRFPGASYSRTLNSLHAQSILSKSNLWTSWNVCCYCSFRSMSTINKIVRAVEKWQLTHQPASRSLRMQIISQHSMLAPHRLSLSISEQNRAKLFQIEHRKLSSYGASM